MNRAEVMIATMVIFLVVLVPEILFIVAMKTLFTTKEDNTDEISEKKEKKIDEKDVRKVNLLIEKRKDVHNRFKSDRDEKGERVGV